MNLGLKLARSRRLAIVGAVAAGAISTCAVATPANAAPKVTSTYSCSADGYSFSGSVGVVGSTPASVAPKATVKMTGLQTSVTLSAADVSELVSLGITSFSGKVTAFDVIATDAPTTTINAAKVAWQIATTKLTSGKAVTITLPKTAKTVGAWKAKKAGTMTFTAGKMNLSLTAAGSTLAVACTASGSTTISTTTVS